MQISRSDIVRVRRASWRIVEVQPYERCHLVKMVGTGATNAGVVREFLAPFDDVERIERRTRVSRISRRLWRSGCRALLATNTPPGSLQCARTARIDLLPHQLEPALAVIRGAGARVLLADDVGLGKTIQAGLIVSELHARGAAGRALILTPSGLRDQWARELASRFGIEAAVLDVRALRRAVGTLAVGVNPWQTVPVAVVSIDYIKRPEILGAASACRWDVVIVDEAHGVAGDSDRHAAAAALADRASYVVLLTATPHNGDRRSFAALCGIGAAGDEPLLVFRRSRRDVRLSGRRRVHRLHVRLSGDEVQMHAALGQFSRAIRQQYAPTHARASVDPAVGSGGDWCLALSVLHKRALSSARSLQQSVDRRLAALADGAQPASRQLQLPLGDPEGELTMADASPIWSPMLSLRNAAHERYLLEALSHAAARAAARESKITALGKLLRRVNEPAIVFTEYRDTLMHVQTALELESVVMLHGGMGRDERRSVLDRFTSGAARVLLATDAAGEGLNLQNASRIVINLELPWSPTRLEQRIGRVDRIGQPRTVHAFHLVARESGESRLLSRLQSRIARARADVGGSDPLGFASAEEDVIARAMVVGESSPRELQHVSNDPSPPLTGGRQMDATAILDGVPGPLLQVPSFAVEANREAARIAAARVFVKRGDEQSLTRLDARVPGVAAARKWSTRAALGGRTLTLWRVAADDGGGRRVSSVLIAAAIDDWRESLRDEVRRCVEESAEAWRAQVLSSHRAFIDVRVARERSLREAGAPEGSQPGLFDRRNERVRLAMAVAEQAQAQDRAERRAALERAQAVTFSAAQLLLVLTP